jgi:hypothetical protein
MTAGGSGSRQAPGGASSGGPKARTTFDVHTWSAILMTARAAINVVRTARTEHLADYGKRLCPVDYAAMETAIEDKISSGSLRVPGVTRTPSNWSQPCSTAAAAHPGQQPLAVEDVLAALPMDLQSEADGDVLDPFGARGEGAASATGGGSVASTGSSTTSSRTVSEGPGACVTSHPRRGAFAFAGVRPMRFVASSKANAAATSLLLNSTTSADNQPRSSRSDSQTPRPCFRDDTMIDAASEATR